jgi:hypothetical protein
MVYFLKETHILLDPTFFAIENGIMMIDHWIWGYPISRQTQIMKHLHYVSNVGNPIPNAINNYHDWGWLESHP